MKEKKFKIRKIPKKTILAFIICAITFSMIGATASTLLYSKDVTYDNSSSGLSSTNLQDALDELYEQAKTGGASVSCDDDGNCTVTCKQGDPTITDSGYTCSTTTNVTCPSDKPNYVATSIGYKCTSTVYVYAFNTSRVTIGTSTLTDLGTSYATFAEAAASNSNSDGVIALKYTVENNVLTEGYACFLKGGAEYCLKGYDTNAFANNVAILNTSFPDCGASASNSLASCYYVAVYASATYSGNVYARSNSSYWTCYVDNDGYGDAYCVSGGGAGN